MKHEVDPQMKTDQRSRDKVLIVTPVGIHGRGGIDRLNLYMSTHVQDDPGAPELVFLGSRGEWRGPLWIVYFLGSLFRYVWMLATGGFDLVHIHVSTDGSAYRKCIFGWITRAFRRPYVIHFHGDMSQAGTSPPPLWVKALANLARGAHYSIVLGKAFVPSFRDVLGVPASRIRIVHNGIPDIGTSAHIPRPARDPVHILFSGEVGVRKGVDLLVEALKHLPADSKDWRCTIAGNGALEPWQNELAKVGLEDKVTFTGWLDIGRIHDLMCDADIVVLPSRAEALPLSLIEGASAGAALISCDVGAVREVVLDGDNGIIVPHDGKAVAAALDRLLRDNNLRSKMQSASRALFVRAFDMRIFVASILAVHREARGSGGIGIAAPAAAE